MTKDQLQKELLERMKPGVKPSDFRKLKRSKSEGDIPKAPLSKSQSNPPTTEIEKLDQETTAKSDTIALLRKKIEDLEKTNPPSQLLQDQLQEKQSQIENLRQQLEDNSLLARHQNLKD